MKSVAEESLRAVDIPLVTLRDQWSQQVAAQTKPAPRMLSSSLKHPFFLTDLLRAFEG